MKNADYELRNKLSALGATLSTTDRIITGNPDVVVRFATPHIPGAPSSTDGRHIHIDPDKVSLRSASDLVNVLGLNYHEVCHILYSPRANNRAMQQILTKNMHKAWNILEDMRIETLFASMYGNAAKFFTAPVMTYLGNDPRTWDMAFLMTYGRRFLPSQIREEFENRFAGDTAQTTRAKLIIDAYRGINFTSTDPDYVVSLVSEFHKLIGELIGQGADDSMGETHPECSANGARSEGEPDEEQEQAASRRREEEDETREEEENDGEDEADAADAAGTAGHPEGEQGDSGEPDDAGSGEDPAAETPAGADGSGGGADGPGEGDGEGDDANADGPQGRGAGSPSGGDVHEDDGDGGGVEGEPGDGTPTGPERKKHKPMTDRELVSKIVDVVDEIENDEEIRREITSVEAGMDDVNRVDLDAPSADGYDLPVSREMGSASSAIETELLRLQSEFEPGWDFGSDHGRLNIARASDPENDPDSWYDLWDEGHDQDAGLEVCILLDLSGSMDQLMRNQKDPYARGTSRIDHASKALWTLKRALDRVEATTSVIGFGHELSTVYSRHDKVDGGVYRVFDAPGDDTLPGEGLKEAGRILQGTDKPNRLFVLITDGQVRGRMIDQYTSENLPGLVESIDAVRILVGVDLAISAQRADFVSKFDVAKTIGQGSELVELVNEAVTSMLRTAQSR